MGREEGGGFRMGNACIPVADSFLYLEGLGGREIGFKMRGTHVPLQLVHIDVWQKNLNIVK